MVETIKGKVQKVIQRAKNFGVLINGEWFNGLGKTDLEENQEAELKYECKNNFNKIVQKDTPDISYLKPKDINELENPSLNKTELSILIGQSMNQAISLQRGEINYDKYIHDVKQLFKANKQLKAELSKWG